MLDLHCHSTASDGTVPPSELPAMARKIGLKALALTDHDTIDGVEMFMTAAEAVPELRCIPGIELACRLENGYHCHIVGLFVDWKNEALQQLCKQILIWRKERNINILKKLADLGMPLDFETLKAQAGGIGDDVVGRPHIAAALVRGGYCKKEKDAFEKYIGRGRPAYCMREVADVPMSIRAIHDAGGLAILAHPFTSFDNSKVEAVAVELQKSGLDGMEAYYSEYSITQQNTAIQIAGKLGLALSGGSDFHGAHHQNIMMGTGYGGLCVPDKLLVELDRRHSSRIGK